MRIAFHGKGGAGKTTTAAGFIKYMANIMPFVLAVDADLNTHLKAALSFPGDSRYLSKHFDEIISYLKGSRSDLGDRPMICNTPPSFESNFVYVSKDEPFLKKYALVMNNIALLTVGSYEERDISSTCYHEKLKSIIGLFHHMLDDENEIIVVDTVAGTDNIATSLSFAYDMNVFVVEPSKKSLKVYQDYADLIPQFVDRLYVIGNKVADAKDQKFIENNVPAEAYLGSIPFSKNLRHFEQGNEERIEQFYEEQNEVFDGIYNTLKSKKRNWQEYLKLLRAAYKWDCDRWYSDFYRCDLLEGIDKTFDYGTVLANSLEVAMTKRG